MQYLSLEQDVIDWANKCLSFATGQLNHKDMNAKMRGAGYDIRENAKVMGEFYESVESMVSL